MTPNRASKPNRVGVSVTQYAVPTPAWLMPGLWELAVTVRPPGGPALSFGLADTMRS